MITIIVFIIDVIILSSKIYTIANFKAPKLSGHLVDLSAVMARLQPNSMNASRTNLYRRAEKAQHHHSALVSSEFAGGCISLP